MLLLHPFPPDLKRLQSKERFYRIRVGDYRIIYQVDKRILLVLVVSIGHRKEVYRRISR
ncbi:MAG TPA: type II toxin-antitoxin system RelE/ParE family toxin [Thermodesulfobacteriota bacterium]|nr:type II toxin-antitoxin system RelE/ParE family toxin [Thermodesulfobacteriota bacterium]